MELDEDQVAGPEHAPPVILADAVVGTSFHAGTIRLLLMAWGVRDDGVKCGMISGQLALTPGAALQVRTQLDQLLTQLEKQGVIELPRGPLQA